MYATATIEPRLIALLNDTSLESPIPSRLDLPPLQVPSFQKASRKPSPLEPQAGTRRVKTPSLAVQNTLSFDRDVNHNLMTGMSSGNDGLKTSVSLERALGVSSPQSLRKILDDDPTTAQSPISKKRQRTDNSKDEFFQLPEPPKKQKAAKQVVPPIIIGLFEPPPNAALFPPISSSAFHDSHGRNSLNVNPPTQTKSMMVSHKIPLPDQKEPKVETKSTKKPHVRVRKKWTEAETTHILLGVKKHGLGSWTKILQDPDFQFNGRKAVDLKDRFRTCCPEELRGSRKKQLSLNNSGEHTDPGIHIVKHVLPLENLVGDSSYLSSDGSNGDEQSSGIKKPHGNRAHRKKVADLVPLGINEPFKKSKRRERHLFSKEEDSNILRGWAKYGASWARIQKDPDLGLSARRPTDIRDRLRNKFPGRYNNPEVDIHGPTTVASTATSQMLPILQPPTTALSLDQLSGQDRGQVQTNTSLWQDLKPLSKTSASLLPLALPVRDIFADLLDPTPANDAPDTLSFSQSFDWSDGTMAPFTSSLGDMEISRILLDENDSWSTLSNIHGKSKQSCTDINSIITSTDPSPNQLSPIYAMASHEPSQIINLPVP